MAAAEPAAARPRFRLRLGRWERWLASGRGRWLGMALAALFAVAMLMPDPGPLFAVRPATFDQYQVLLPRVRQSDPALIVKIDDESLARIGQWPWPRDTIATLIDRINARTPSAIALDVLFIEPDRSSPERLAQSLRSRTPGLAEQLAKMRPNDEILAESIERAPVVLGMSGADEVAPTDAARARAAATYALPFTRYPGATHSLPLLDRAARARGIINVEPERGIVRRVPLAAYVGGDVVLSLAVESYRTAMRGHGATFTNRHGVLLMQLGDTNVPMQNDGNAWMYFANEEPPRVVSAADVLEGKDNPAQYIGRIAIIGVTAQALLDQYTTPQGDRIPGVEIHAQIIENLVDEAFLSRPPWARYGETLAFVLGAALLIFYVPQVRPRRSFGIVVGCWVLFIAAGIAAFAWAHTLVDPATPIAGITVLYGLMLSATLVGLDVQRRQLSQRLAAERVAAARVTGELEAARRIQTGMLPTRESVLQYERRVEIFANMSAAREVGGDLYDFFPLPGDRFVVLVGDVSGKGLPAAMFMAVSKALAKSCALRSRAGPAAIVTMLNQEISRENPEQMFVTMAVLVLDLKTGDLDYCNAGHEPPLVSRRNGGVLVLDEGGGPPVCVIDDYPYEQASIRLEPRDVLVLASDGLTEAMNRDSALYGRERLKVLLDSPMRRGVDPTVLGNEILGAIKAFEGGSEPADDQTLLLVSWRGAV